MKDLDTHSFPNGGWQFRQPQTGWTAPSPISNTFDQQVVHIVKHRQKNPAVVLKHKLSTDPESVGIELLDFNRARLGIPKPLAASSFFQRPPGDGEVAAGGDNWFRNIVRAGSGAITLGDWLGKGAVPVEQALAENRATICADCPMNQEGDLLSFFTKPTADLIRRQLEERNAMKLQTEKDAQLNICDACGCPLRLKVHVPLDVIKAHIRQTEWSRLDPRCWMLHEK